LMQVGDWGRRGQYNQSHVAAMMSLQASLVGPDFVVSVGDNFYPSGLSSPSDEAFSKSFSDAYSAKSLQVPWYTILGNHDYGDKCYDEQPGCYPTGDLDWRWNCERTFQMHLAGGDVEFFFIDTSPFVQKYYYTPWANFTGEQSWQRQLAQLEVNLMTSRAKWKIVFGHHPPRSNGHHNNTVELIEHVEPLLQAAGVQAYFAGHDHNLEHIHMPRRTPHYIISGGGSKTERPFEGREGSLFQWPSSGFVSVKLFEEEIAVEFF
ncbi:Metallo-dependent phosphatase, partial [Coccomyxa subellipsoidea C-169]